MSDRTDDVVAGGEAAAPGRRHLTVLRADCARCVGLCCVVPAFARSADFAIDKPAGHPCPNLGTDHRCTIHDRLRPSGFPGCVVFDCFGAGQKVAAVALAGRDWRTSPDAAAAMMVAFPVVRALHELLWYLDAALARPSAAPVHAALAAAYDDVDGLTTAPASELAAVDVDAVRARVNPVLQRAGELVRAGAPRPGRELRGADLTDALFLTGTQLESARGDASTRLSPTLAHPAHWRVWRGGAPPAPRRRRPGERGG